MHPLHLWYEVTKGITMANFIRYSAYLITPIILFFSFQAASYDAIFNITGRVSTNTCSLSSSRTQNIFLGDRSIGENNFGLRVGSETNSVKWTLELDCDKGTNINIKLSGSAVPGNKTALKLNSETGSAKGVGIATYIGDNGIAYILREINQERSITTSKKGATTIYFSSAYVQTDSVIEPGKANASMDVDIIYN